MEELARNPFAISLELVPAQDVPFPGIVIASSRSLNYHGFLEQNGQRISRETVGNDSEDEDEPER